jgi:hypothetical protein
MTKLPTTLERTDRSKVMDSTPSLQGKQPQREEPRRVPWYASALCWLGLHWGKWDYLGERNCSQILICGRCAKTRTRTKHLRKWEYVKEGACQQVRICSRCQAESGLRMRHLWGQTSSYGTTASHTCKRCGNVETWTVNDG